MSDMNTSMQTLLGHLKSELGFDLEHGFLARVADELCRAGALPENLRTALTSGELRLIESCAELAFRPEQAVAA